MHLEEKVVIEVLYVCLHMDVIGTVDLPYIVTLGCPSLNSPCSIILIHM